MPMLSLVLSSDSHVFEPPDLWQTRIDRAFRDRAPRIERIAGADQIVVERDQILSGIGLITVNLGARCSRTMGAKNRPSPAEDPCLKPTAAIPPTSGELVFMPYYVEKVGETSMPDRFV